MSARAWRARRGDPDARAERRSRSNAHRRDRIVWCPTALPGQWVAQGSNWHAVITRVPGPAFEVEWSRGPRTSTTYHESRASATADVEWRAGLR